MLSTTRTYTSQQIEEIITPFRTEMRDLDLGDIDFTVHQFLDMEQLRQTGSLSITLDLPFFLPYEDVFREERQTAKQQRGQKEGKREILQRSRDYFQAHKNEILRKYVGKYIAIISEETESSVDPDLPGIVGVADDFHALATAILQKYGYRTIYMTFVSKKPQPIHIPSVFLPKK